MRQSAPPRRAGPGRRGSAGDLEAELRCFLGGRSDACAARLARLATKGAPFSSFNLPAAAFGPWWAASRGAWAHFWVASAVEAACLVGLARSLWSGGGEEAPGLHGALFAASIVAFLSARALQGALADRALWRAWRRWRHGLGAPARHRPVRAAGGAFLALAFAAVSIWRYGIPRAPDFLEKFPAPRVVQRAAAKGIDAGVDWMVLRFESFFDAITLGLRESLNLFEALLVGLPWPLAALLVVALAWRAAGWKVAAFSVLALAYLGLFGYWEKSMSTLSLVLTSALLCVLAGAPLGIWCGKDERVYSMVKPVLDFMQTMPSFVYLIPAVAFFSIGKPPGVFATVIFAMPPMIRLAALGIQQVPHDVKEAALSFGATSWELLVKVELPLAVPSLLAGLNQTIMMSLSMVIVASMIGAGGLGYDVLKALRQLNTGEGMLAGTAIVVCAMILDRIVQGKTARRRPGSPDGG